MILSPEMHITSVPAKAGKRHSSPLWSLGPLATMTNPGTLQDCAHVHSKIVQPHSEQVKC